MQEPTFQELRRSFTEFLARVLLLGRLPETSLPEVGELGEVKAMLAERVKEWASPWVEQGRQEGLQQGVHKGQAQLLIRQLENRFGTLDEHYRLMIAEADDDQLLQWSDRMFKAQTIEQVFERA